MNWQNIKFISLLPVIIGASPISAEVTVSQPMMVGKDIVLAPEGPLERGTMTLRIRLLSSENQSIYRTYEVERHDINCTAAIVKNVKDSGNYVSWTSMDERETSYYGRTTFFYPAPIYYYRVDMSNYVLEKRLLGRRTMSGRIQVGRTKRTQLTKYDLDWAQMLDKVQARVC